MNKRISSTPIKAITAGIILVLLIFENSTIGNDGYAAKKNILAQNESTPPEIPTPPLGSTTFLSVITKVDNTNGGTKKPSDFTISRSENRRAPKSFSGCSSGTPVKLKAVSYR